MTAPTTLPRERADLVESLRWHRSFLRFTVRGLTDEQALQRPTVGALNLAGLIEHVGATEAGCVAAPPDPDADPRTTRAR